MKVWQRNNKHIDNTKGYDYSDLQLGNYLI